MIRERIKDYLSAKHLSVREFERICGLGNGVVSRLSKTTSPSTLNKIESNSDLNLTWLLTGEGEMLKQGPTQIVSGQGAHHFTQTGDVEAAPDAAAQFSTIDRLIDEMAAQRETFKSTVDQLLSVLNKFADKSRTDL